MSTDQRVERDERAVAIENASCKLACTFLTYALLLDVAYRGLVRNEGAWDLMALVIVSSGIVTLYQARYKTLRQGWLWKVTLIGFVAAAIGAVLAAILTMAKSM